MASTNGSTLKNGSTVTDEPTASNESVGTGRPAVPNGSAVTSGSIVAVRPIARLQFLTMDEGPLDHLEQIEMACRAGVRWVQLRMKEAGSGLFMKTALAAREICNRVGATLIINDRVELVKPAGADGVHLGRKDMPLGEARRVLGDGYLIGGTANTVEDILDCRDQGADYIGLGPYRYTTTKKKLSPLLGAEGYARIMELLKVQGFSVPLVAIGGIRAADAGELLDMGIYGIAFSGLLMHAEDREGVVTGLHSLLNG